MEKVTRYISFSQTFHMNIYILYIHSLISQSKISFFPLKQDKLSRLLCFFYPKLYFPITIGLKDHITAGIKIIVTIGKIPHSLLPLSVSLCFPHPLSVSSLLSSDLIKIQYVERSGYISLFYMF